MEKYGMERVKFKKGNCLAFLLLFVLSLSFCSAQENDIYKMLLKESINMDFILDHGKIDKTIENREDHYVELNVNKKPLVMLGYNYKLNSLLLNYKDSLQLEPKYTVSPFVTMKYTNTEDDDPFANASTEAIFLNGTLTPVLGLVKLNPIIIAKYLMDIGVLDKEPFVKKENKKEKALRIIKEMYKVEE